MLAESSTSRLAEQLPVARVQTGQELIVELDEVMKTNGGSEIGGTRFLNGRLTVFVTQTKNRRTGSGRSFVCR
jgi:hypothetical protein